MNNDVIFIHIPKTGGTTINAAMQNSYWQTTPDHNYRHILADKTSNAGDIFDGKNIDKYKKNKIFMMLRHPIDRVTSEYHFIKERVEFTKYIKSKPTNFEQYITSYQTQNGVVNFLKGGKMYNTLKPSEKDLEYIKQAITTLPIYTGIFEDFEKSLSYFTSQIGIKWAKKVEAKRMTFKRPNKEDLSPKIKNLIIENNSLDMELYSFCKSIFDKETQNLKPTKINFIKDKYNHVVPYCMKWCFFEFCVDDKQFLKQNFNYFKSLTFYLINNLNIRDGVKYTKSWNETFLNSVKLQSENLDFYNYLSSEYNINNDPLENLYLIGEKIDAFLKINSNKLYLKFVPEEVIVPKNKLFGIF